jgi:hypothetical protein
MEKNNVDHYTLVQHAQIVKVTKITKESFLTVRPVFSTEDFREKRGTKNQRIQKQQHLIE